MERDGNIKFIIDGVETQKEDTFGYPQVVWDALPEETRATIRGLRSFMDIAVLDLELAETLELYRFKWLLD